MITYRCEHCGYDCQAHDQAQGRTLPCPTCHQPTQVPFTSVFAAGSVPVETSRFKCPYCGSRAEPITKESVSAVGQALAIVLLCFCLPLFWIGFFITDRHQYCQTCGVRLS